jgi:hypothetical protein
MKSTYSIVQGPRDLMQWWTVVWSVAGQCDLPIDLYPTESEAQLEADRLLALAWAPEI